MAFDADVLIIGAGPAGCATAIPLAKAGHSVLLIERDPFDAGEDMTSGEVLALATQNECLGLGVNLDADWVFDRLHFVRNVYPDLSWTLHEVPRGLGHIHVDRGGFNAALRVRAQMANAKLAVQSAVTGVEISRDAVRVQTRAGDEYSAQILVDASGRNSVVLNQLSLKEPEEEFRQVGVAVFFDSFEGTPPLTWDRHLYGTDGAMISGSRIRPGLYRYILEADLSNKQAGKMRPLDYFEQIAAQHDPWISERLASEPRTGNIWAMAPLGYRVSRLAGDRFVLVGDAGGYLSPITGQGMEFAMRTGRLAAVAVDAALRSRSFEAASFNSYVKSREEEVVGQADAIRAQLRLFGDREALSRCARDDEFRAQRLMSLPVVDRGTLLN